MATPTPSSSAVWRIPGLVVLVLIAVTGFAYAASERKVGTIVRSATFPAADRLRLESGAGDMIVRGEDRSDIQVTSRIRSTGRPPVLTTDTSGTTRTVRASCQHSFFNLDIGGDDFGIGPLCDVDYDVRVPAETLLTLHVGQGDVHAEGLQSRSVSVGSGTGDVVLDFTTAPQRVDVGTGTGDVLVRVPAGTYAISTDTGIGDVRVGLGIVDDPNAANEITIESGTGDVIVERSDV